MQKQILSLFLLIAFGSSARAQDNTGVYVRLLDISVEPQDAPRWESAIEIIAGAARDSQLEFCCDWLLYRQGPFRYRAIFFSDGLRDLVTPTVFANAFDGTPGETAFSNGVRQLQATSYKVAHDVVHQMVEPWSTVNEMSTTTHPKGRLTLYWVRPGAEKEFDAAMREQAALLKAVQYPYPVEGFKWKVGSPGVNYIALFPDSWAGFFGENDLRTVMRRHDREADYEMLLERIAATVYKIEQQDIDFEHKLSY